MRTTTNRLSYALGFLSLLVCMGCGADGSLDEEGSQPVSENDFRKSEVITNGPGIADGQSPLLVVVQLTNSNGTPVASHKPNYTVTGVGVTPSACTTSNIHGVSTCVLKAAQIGTKKVAFTNVKITLEKEVVFQSPSAVKPIIGLVSANKTLASGTHQFSGTVSGQEPGAIKTSGSYKFFGAIQGEAFSR